MARPCRRCLPDSAGDVRDKSRIAKKSRRRKQIRPRGRTNPAARRTNNWAKSGNRLERTRKKRGAIMAAMRVNLRGSLIKLAVFVGFWVVICGGGLVLGLAQWAVTGKSPFGKPPTLEPVIADLKAGDDHQREKAAQKLAGARPDAAHRQEVLDGLHEALKHENKHVRAAAVRALGTWGSQEDVPEIIKTLESSEEE